MRHLWRRGLFAVAVLAAVGLSTGPVGLLSWSGVVLGGYLVLVLALLVASSHAHRP